MKNHLIGGVVALIVSWGLAACEESLPAREDLLSQITTSVAAGFLRQNGVHYIRIYITIKNNIDETIEESAVLKGNVELTWLPNNPDDIPKFNYSRSFSLNAANVLNASGYDPSTGKLSLRPGDSIIFFVNWDLKTNDSTSIKRWINYRTDTQCEVLQYDDLVRYRKISDRQHLKISSSIRLFDQLANIYSQNLLVSTCFVGDYRIELNPANEPCYNVNILDPCGLVGN